MIILTIFTRKEHNFNNDITQKNKEVISFSFVEEEVVEEALKSFSQKEEVWQKKAVEEVKEVIKEKKEELPEPIEKKVIEEEVLMETTKEQVIEEIVEDIVEEITEKEALEVEEAIKEVDDTEEIIEEPIEEKKEEIKEQPIVEKVERVVEEVKEVKEMVEVRKDRIEEEGSSIIDNLVEEQDLIVGSNGEYIVKNQDIAGLSYTILKSPNPSYPSIAKKARIRQEVAIKVRFLVGYTGRVEEVKFYDNVTKYGFRDEVEKTLKEWELSPIEVDGKGVKMYFYKVFKFKIS